MILESSNLGKLLRGFVRTLGNWVRHHGLPLFALVAVSVLSGVDGHALELEQATQNSKVTSAKATRFITFGHTYASIDTPQRRQELIDRINSEQVDYVFVLGDSDAWQDDVASEYRNKIDAKTFFLAGNHDLVADTLGENRKSRYIEAIGYLDAVVIEHDSNFILINSSEGLDHIKAFLKESLTKTNPENVTILLAHHRIWDDNLISPAPYQQNKSFYFDDLFPTIERDVDYIFSGNRPYIYTGSSGGIKNKDIVYSCDVVKGIVGCANGMRGHNASYLVVEVVGDKLLVLPRSYPLRAAEAKSKPTYSALYIEFLSGKVYRILKHNHFWIGIIVALVISSSGYSILLLFRRVRRSRGQGGS